ncbi:hypothetical protein HPB47_018504 [Ixodes persulcatus]|uniref:Uncharacterized protein n=1 Tax=Ixodes persulcatus TaxID=34615 RepID=A0AC60QMI3_IXOPE|nr:hypothetical protein HPB47_018504 [Ixodes persulcatus]
MQPPPDVLLLQETRTPTMTLPCYNFYTNPTIETAPSIREKNPVTKRGWAAVGILRHIPQAQLDTAALCSTDSEVVAARIRHGRTKFTVASVYLRPGTEAVDGEMMQWIKGLIKLAEGDPIIVAGDFNSPHRYWGYTTNTRRGKDILEAMNTVGLELLNAPGVKTRLAKQRRQKDSTPDLSWASRCLDIEWTPWKDSLGSDHFPLEMKLRHGQGTGYKEKRPVVKWDRFRELLEAEDGQDVEMSIRKALQEAKTEILVKPDAPTPDNHLLNLWASRLQALQKYGKKKTLRNKIKLNHATAKANRYTKELGRTRWRTHCEPFNQRTGLGKAWLTYRGLDGRKRRKRNAAQNLALKLNISEEELAIKAAPTTSRATAEDLDMPLEAGMEDQLGMGELIDALFTTKTNSAPGPDGVSYQALRNLPEEATKRLLDKYNQVWESGRLPEDWKLSWVTPITKPGKPLDRIENLRPVSLTSNVGKTMEKIVLRRIQWYLEKHECLDPRQTGFREAMGEQEWTMQRGIEQVLEYLKEFGMEASPEKTQYMVEARPRHHRKGIANSIRLEMNGQEIGRKQQIKILGVTFEETARSTKWLPEIEKNWVQGLKLIRKTTNKSWGADEKALRILAEALLTSRALYSCNWLNLTRGQWKKLERLNHRSMRVITGLPNFTPLEELRQEAQMSRIEDRADVQNIAQFQRLERTRQGRRLLEDMGYDIGNKPPLEELLPPWQDEACEEHGRGDEIRYTDAARTEGASAAAWHDPRRSKGTSVKEAELRAILAAIEDILSISVTASKARIFTDSQEAIIATRCSRPKGRTTKKIKKMATELRERGTELYITWLPGHSGIAGNERAHRAAVEAAHYSSTLGPTSPSGRHETVDPEEQAELVRQSRKAYLRGLLPPQEDKIPTGPRRLCTPAKLASFGLLEPEEAKCKTCTGNNMATLQHLLWNCKGLDRHRQEALQVLREEDRPRTLDEWARPRGSPQHRKALLDSLMDYIRKSGTHNLI